MKQKSRGIEKLTLPLRGHLDILLYSRQVAMSVVMALTLLAGCCCITGIDNERVPHKLTSSREYFVFLLFTQTFLF